METPKIGEKRLPGRLAVEPLLGSRYQYHMAKSCWSSFLAVEVVKLGHPVEPPFHLFTSLSI